eukprot:13779-Heterococcus_DN1.PRE.3
MSSFLVTTLLLQSAQLQWANHPLRMSGPDNTTHVRLDGGSATPITFVHNLLDFTGEGALQVEAHSAFLGNSTLKSIAFVLYCDKSVLRFICQTGGANAQPFSSLDHNVAGVYAGTLLSETPADSAAYASSGSVDLGYGLLDAYWRHGVALPESLKGEFAFVI